MNSVVRIIALGHYSRANLDCASCVESLVHTLQFFTVQVQVLTTHLNIYLVLTKQKQTINVLIINDIATILLLN